MRYELIPYLEPSKILKYFNMAPLQALAANPQEHSGDPVEFKSLWEYFGTIPEKFRNSPEFINHYHNGLLRISQLLVNEGLLTPLGNAWGMDQKFKGNGYREDLAKYGYYDFLVFGFPYVRATFEECVRPVLVDSNEADADPSIGTGFGIIADRKVYFVTARHCIPVGRLISIPLFVPPDEALQPVNIYCPENDNIDVALIEVSELVGISDQHLFLLDEPHVLDDVLIVGYPPIQGFTEAIQVSETAAIAAMAKSTIGAITGMGQHYGGGLKDHFLVSARVKPGNSGGPVINRHGMVVGVIIEEPMDGDQVDLLGYGMAISANVVREMLDSIRSGNTEGKLPIKKLNFKGSDKGFIVGN